jgi:hypothetical protein
MNKNIKQTEKWLDERYKILNITKERLADTEYYKGALAACEWLGYECKRDENGKHTLLGGNFENIYTNNTIGQPMTPSKWVSNKPTYTPITRIKMTCGGGIGGSSWYEYVKRINMENIRPDDMLIVTDINARQKLLNTRYIVSVENDLSVLSALLDSQNNNFEVGIYEYRWLVRDGHKVKLINDFMQPR